MLLPVELVHQLKQDFRLEIGRLQFVDVVPEKVVRFARGRRRQYGGDELIVKLHSPQFLDQVPRAAYVGSNPAAGRDLAVLRIQQVRLAAPVVTGQVPALLPSGASFTKANARSCRPLRA